MKETGMLSFRSPAPRFFLCAAAAREMVIGEGAPGNQALDDTTAYSVIVDGLSSRLLPVAIGVALLVGVLTPLLFYGIGCRSMALQTARAARQLAAEVGLLAEESPDLMKNTSRKVQTMQRNLLTVLDVTGMQILDENGAAVAEYQFTVGREKSWWDSSVISATAPIVSNARQIGSVELFVSKAAIVKTSVLLLAISSLVGTGTAFLVYLLPLRVVTRRCAKFADVVPCHPTDREEGRELLRVSAQGAEQRFREFVQGLDAIVWEADALSWRFLFVSQQAVKILGYPVEAWLAEPRFTLGHIHPDDRERVHAAYQLAIQEESGFQLEYRMVAADRHEVWIQDFVRIARDAGSGGVQMSGIMVDITERKRGEEALAEQARELARSNADLEQFVQVASHDLQEPLRMITSYLQLLERRYQGRLDKDAEEFIAFAVDGAIRMKRLIQDLVVYSQVDAHGRELQLTDTMDCCKQALANLHLAIEESGAVVRFEQHLPAVMGDMSQLVQLFQNLLGNALKFRGADPPQLTIGARRSGNSWLFSLRDNGIGIERNDVDRIFQIFQRLHTPGQYPGTGLGLALCQKIVERHGGRIWVESTPGEGATFFFTLPLRGEMVDEAQVEHRRRTGEVSERR